MPEMIRPDGFPLHPEDGWSERHQIAIATAPHVRVTEWAGRRRVPWDLLIVDHLVMEDKASAPLWSPVLLSQPARQKSSVTHVTALVYDIDKGQQWDEVASLLEVYGVRHWMYSTHSHTEEVHKFRVVLGLDEAIPAADFPRVWTLFAESVGWDVDQACRDCSRLFYVPSTPGNGAPAWQAWGDGCSVDWRAILDAAPVPPPPAAPRVLHAATYRGGGDRDARIHRRVAERILEAVSPSCGMAQWWAICCGVVDKLGRDGFEMVRAWSKACPEKFRLREWQAMERRFNV